MGTINEDLTAIETIEEKIAANKVANFAYTNAAYASPLDYADGVSDYNVNNEQNIPIADAATMNVNETILTKGWRSQASSITRMLMNHFLGRISYNLNWIHDNMVSLVNTIKDHIGEANGIAPLNENGYVPIANGGTNAGDVTGARTNLNINNVANTGDSANVSSGGTTKFTTGGAYNLLTSLAPYFSASVSYSIGKLVTYQNKLYECTSVHSVGAWNASHFTERSIAYLIDNNILTTLAPLFSSSSAYAIGDYVTYNGKLYRCTTAHSAGAWNSSDFTEVTAGGELEEKADRASIGLPANAEIHYSFDDLPSKVPDGTYVYKRDKNFTSSDYWSRESSNFTQSIENDCLKWTWTAATTGTAQANRYINNLSNKYCVLKIKANVTLDNARFVMLLGVNSSLSRLADTRLHNGDNFISFMIPANAETYAVWQVINLSQNDYVIFEAIYFGDGSDSMPVLDNSGNGHNTVNTGVVKADGVRGSSALFAGGTNNVLQTIKISEYNRTFSLWFGLSNFSSGVLFSNNNGFYVQVSSRRLLLHYGSESIDLAELTAETEYTYKYYHLAVVCDADYIKVYLDSVLLKTVSVTVLKNANMIYLGALNSSGTNGFYGKIDDFQIFSRVLTDKEVTALYLNKADTPKYYDINNYNLDHIPALLPDVASVGGSGKYIESISQIDGAITAVEKNLPDVPSVGGNGKYIKSISQTDGAIAAVEESLDTAPVQNSTKPVTSGALYNFFEGNTDYKAWLGKVFGWALGRNWTQGSQATDITFTDVCYANGHWVAVSSGGGIWGSTDGRVWVKYLNDSSQFTKVYYANNLFVALSVEGMFYSQGGVSWERASGGSLVKFTDICFNGNNWVATADEPGYKPIWESSNGTVWEASSTLTTNQRGTSVKYNGGKWVVTFYNVDTTDGKGEIAYRTGNSGAWTVPSYRPINQKCLDSCYANGLWVVGTDNGLYWGENGEYLSSWTQISGTSNVTFNKITYANGIWVAGSNAGVWWSANGKTWNRGEGLDGINSISFYRPYYSNGLWVIPCNNHIFWSEDGKRWTMGKFTGDANINCNNVFSINGIWVAACAPLCGMWYSDITNADIQ